MKDTKFPTPAMQKAQEEWNRKTEAEKEAMWNAVRAELERYYKNWGRSRLNTPEVQGGAENS